MAWVKGHKNIKGNMKTDKISKETSILGHESKGVVTPAGLRAWARRERKEARGGGGEGVLGWHRKAISAYTWCVTGKGPQRKWLHHIKKTDSPICGCGPLEQSGEHLVERCELLAEGRKLVEQDELCTWRSRYVHKKEKKKKGPVGPEKEEEEADRLEIFFCKIHDFHNPVPVAPGFVPAELPPRYAINFVPTLFPRASSADVPFSPVFVPSTPSSSFSVVSSANFVIPFPSTHCMPTT